MSAVAHALQVMEAVAIHQPIGVSALAAELGMSKSTAQRALRSLADEGWIAPAHADTTKWVITTKAFAIGSRHTGASNLRELTRGAMNELSRTAGETVHLSAIDQSHLIIIELVEAESPVRTHTRIGDRFPLHATASGIAILAAMTPDASCSFLDGVEFEKLTDATPTDRSLVGAAVEAARTLGYAVTVGTRHVDIAAVGAAIVDRRSKPVAALSISAPVHRLPDAKRVEYGELVKSAAAGCSGIYTAY